MKQIQYAKISIEIHIFEISCFVTSYVAVTFHPTIVQCAHQSLSNIATPEFGMIPIRNKEH